MNEMVVLVIDAEWSVRLSGVRPTIEGCTLVFHVNPALSPERFKIFWATIAYL